MILPDAASITAFEQRTLAERDLPTSTYEALQRSARQWPDATALRFFMVPDNFAQSRRWSYAQLLAEVTRCANAFAALGVQRGEVVALILPNLPETHFCIWGAEAAAIVMPLNPMLEGAQLAELMRAAQVRVLVTMAPAHAPEVWARIAPQLAHLPALKDVVLVGLPNEDAMPCGPSFDLPEPAAEYRVHDYASLLASQSGDRLVTPCAPDSASISSYFCTGGTTGMPKIAVRNHGAEVFDAWAVGTALGGRAPGDVYFCGLPLFHVNAQLVTGLQVWMSGGEVILGTPNGYRTPGLIQRFWEMAAHYRVKVFSGVPTIYASLLQQPRNADISSLEFAVCGAAPMPAELIRQFERDTGVRILEGYGLTEATCVSSLNPLDGERRVGSIGLHLPYQPMRAVMLTEDGGYLRDAAVDEVGVIAISGPSLFNGYLDERHNAAAWFQFEGQRWLNTGDLGRQDAAGYFWLTGRRKELIIRGGHNIDPKQIEETLAQHPAVSMVAAIGSPDPYAGEVPVAYVQLVPGAQTSSEALLAFAAENISERAAIPRYIHILDSLPTTAVGKLFKPALQQREIRQVIWQQAQDEQLAIDIEVIQDPSRGLVVRLSGADAERMRPHLSRYALQIDYLN